MSIIHFVEMGARLALAVLFLTSGVSKLHQFPAFRAAALDYDLGSAMLVRSVARAVPVVELMVGLLWLSPLILPAALASLGLLACFTAVLGITLRRGKRIPCGCFGFFEETPVGWNTLARNAVLAALSLLPLPLGQLGGAGMPATGVWQIVIGSPDGALLAMTTAAFLVVSFLLLDALLAAEAKRATVSRLLGSAAHEGRATA